ncbi:MAG: LapA family protein [Candidatus Obscuribacterales bacterium]|nr:LapA family protein [Candidatus Obscuribacterales bacterium]
MIIRYAVLAISIVLALAFCLAGIFNGQPVQLNMINWQGEIALMVLILGALASGALLGFSITQLKVGKVSQEKKKLEWDAQDAKLAASVKSDREQQLEAKINTLEAALKTALKNK